MANQNGLGAHNAAAYSSMNGSIMPSAGHFSDMQTLMQNMESLGGWLEQNRQDWSQVQEGLARIERLQQSRTSPENQIPQPNGESLPEVSETSQPSITQLQDSLAEAKEEIASLERLSNDQARVQQMYEDGVANILAQVRIRFEEKQGELRTLHEHYTQLLAQSRSETIEAQLTHQAWQAGLQRLSEGVRSALVARQAEGMPWKRRIAALKEENRILRAKVGWDPPVDSDDERVDDEGRRLG